MEESTVSDLPTGTKHLLVLVRRVVVQNQVDLLVLRHRLLDLP